MQVFQIRLGLLISRNF